ncbi:DUF1294 domain-containing protein [Veillonella agrestimuris]|uniref:DUF1294 domain-containing protein n=1 Tax=Veillonella agrestimuris TaxID=2941340 RepID=UPI00204258B8|nr:DUF1294 domain-containing protein [Veillonella agrestimuris]
MSEVYYLGIMGLWNVVVCFVYGYDKLCAMKGYSRISEFSLIALAFAFGGFGALVGMAIWHHKTRKWKFRILVPIALVWTVFALGYGYGWLYI